MNRAIFITFITLIVSGCETSVEDYLKDIQKASDKVRECEQTSTFNQIDCKNAYQALQIDKSNKRKQQKLVEEQKRQEEENKKIEQEKLAKEYLAKLDYVEFFSIYDDHKHDSSEIDEKILIPVARTMYKDKTELAANELQNDNYPSNINQKLKSVCSPGLDYKIKECKAYERLKEYIKSSIYDKSMTMAKSFIDDRTKLKTTYNNCRKTLLEMRKTNKVPLIFYNLKNLNYEEQIRCNGAVHAADQLKIPDAYAFEKDL